MTGYQKKKTTYQLRIQKRITQTKAVVAWGWDVGAKSCNFATLHYNELVHYSLLFIGYKMTLNKMEKTNDMQPSRLSSRTKKQKRRGKCHTCKHIVINMTKSGIWLSNSLINIDLRLGISGEKIITWVSSEEFLSKICYRLNYRVFPM